MAKCVLLFLLVIIKSCSQIEKPENLQIIFTQTGGISEFSQNGEILPPEIISSDLWIFRANKVAVWGIDGDIPDSLMEIQQNSIAVLGENAELPKVLALQFSKIILKPNFCQEKKLLILRNFDGKLIYLAENQKITFTTDGVFWKN